MKKNSIFRKAAVLLFALISVFAISCSSSDDGGGNGGDGNGNGNGGGNGSTESSIILNLNKSFATLSDNNVVFTVSNNLGENVTSQTTFTIDGQEISGANYNFPTKGSYEVVATYKTFTATKSIDVVHSKKILLEDYTGTWCQYCPGAGAAIVNAKAQNDNIFSAAYHISYSSTQGIDPMQIPESLFFAQTYGVNAFPTVHYNGPGASEWNFPNNTQTNAELAKKSNLGLALNAEMVGNYLKVDVDVAFTTLPTQELKLMVYLIEDNVTTSTPQSGSSQGASYVHRDVLREVYTDQLGDLIPAGQISLDTNYSVTLNNLSLPNNYNNFDELRVIAFVRRNTTGNKYQIENVQETHIGSSVGFD